MLWFTPDWKETPRPLTDTQGEVKDAEPDVQPEEEDDVCHFAEQKHVAYVLLQCDCGWERRRNHGCSMETAFPHWAKHSVTYQKSLLRVYTLGHKYLLSWILI